MLRCISSQWTCNCLVTVVDGNVPTCRSYVVNLLYCSFPFVRYLRLGDFLFNIRRNILLNFYILPFVSHTCLLNCPFVIWIFFRFNCVPDIRTIIILFRYEKYNIIVRNFYTRLFLIYLGSDAAKVIYALCF